MQKTKPAAIKVPVKSVYVIDGSGEPVVPSGSKVRVTMSVTSGSELGTPRVRGPVTDVVQNEITLLTYDPPVVGVMNLEFELITTGTGKVTLEVPFTFPGSSEPGVQEVTFLVE